MTSTSASPRSSASAIEQLEDLRLHHHVERGRRLVGEQQLRARRRAPSRSPPAAASRRRTRAGSSSPAPPRSRPARAARPPGARACVTARDPVQLHRLDELLADPLHRVERVHRALEDHRDVAPAVRRHRPLAEREHVLAVEQDAARDRTPSAAAGPSGRGSSSSCRSPTRRRARGARHGRRANETPCTACSSRACGRSNQTWRSSTSSSLPVTGAPAARHGRSRNRRTARWLERRRGLNASSIACPTIVHREHDDHHRDARRHDRPPGVVEDRVVRERVLDQPAPRDHARVAEAEERHERLREDRVGDEQHGVRDQERHHLRQHVPEDAASRCRRRAPSPAGRRRARGRSSPGRAAAGPSTSSR